MPCWSARLYRSRLALCLAGMMRWMAPLRGMMRQKGVHRTRTGSHPWVRLASRLDLAKLVFQVHGADRRGAAFTPAQAARGSAVFRGLSPCIVAMEACGSAHYWAREIARLGHEARLVPPAYVKPYVKRGKTDRSMRRRFARRRAGPPCALCRWRRSSSKASTTLHRCRDLLVKNRTMLVNALRAHLAEFGFVAAKGIGKLPDLIEIVSEAPAEALPEMARPRFGLYRCDRADRPAIDGVEKRLRAWHEQCAKQTPGDDSGVGLIGATALCALVPDPKLFATAATSPPGSGYAKARRNRRQGELGASPKRATARCAGCSCWRPRCCARSRTKPPRCAVGAASALRTRRRRGARQQTARMAGPSWRAARLISRLRGAAPKAGGVRIAARSPQSWRCARGCQTASRRGAASVRHAAPFAPGGPTPNMSAADAAR